MMKKNEEPLISIIVPVYQVEPYLRDCLDSIVGQSYTNWELILIDDGSTDGSGAICDEYALKDVRIQTLHQENAGLSAARNTGLDNIRGEYIAFIDSDDVLLTEEYLRILYDALTDNDAEISMCNLDRFSRNEELQGIYEEPRSISIISGKDIFRRGQHRKVYFQYDAAYLKLFKKECFDGIRFPVGKYVEYLAISHLLVYPRERIAVVDGVLYGYRYRKNSILRTNSNKWKVYVDTLEAFSRQYEYFETLGDMDALSRIRDRLIFTRASYYIFFSAYGGGEKIPSDIMTDGSDLISFDHRRWVYDTLERSTLESAKIAEDRFLEAEEANVKILLALTSSLLFGHPLPEWKRVEPSLPPVLDMATEGNIGYIVCEALKRSDSLSGRKRELYEKYQNTVIRKALRFRSVLRCIKDEVEKWGIIIDTGEQDMLDSLYPTVWFRYPEDVRLISVLSEPADLLKINDIMSDYGFGTIVSETGGNVSEITYENESSERITIVLVNDDYENIENYSSRKGLIQVLTVGFQDMLLGTSKMTLGNLLDLTLLIHPNGMPIDGETVTETEDGHLGVLRTLYSICDKIAIGKILDEELTSEEQRLLLAILRK